MNADRSNILFENEKEIDLLKYLQYLLRKIKWIFFSSVAGALTAALLVLFVLVPEYTATSKLYIVNNGKPEIDFSDLQIGTYLAADYQEVFDNWQVHETVIRELGLPYDYKQITDMIDVTIPDDTHVLYISVSSETAEEAKRMADAYAKAAQIFIADTMEIGTPGLFEEALLPLRPSSLHDLIVILLGFAAGMLLACAALLIRFVLDDRFYDDSDIEKVLNLASLGKMPLQTGDKTCVHGIWPVRKRSRKANAI